MKGNYFWKRYRDKYLLPGIVAAVFLVFLFVVLWLLGVDVYVPE